MTNCKMLLENPYGRALFWKTTTLKLLKSLKQPVAFLLFSELSNPKFGITSGAWFSVYQQMPTLYIAHLLWTVDQWQMDLIGLI